MEQLDVIILAAGRGMRVGATAAKQFLELGGIPVLVRTLSKFDGLPFVASRIVVCPADAMEQTATLLASHGITDCQIIAGGNTRQQSMRNALLHVSTRRVITHNSALPFVTRELIANVVHNEAPCVTTATSFELRLCRGTDTASAVVDHSNLKLINTPQSFQTALFRSCHQQAFEQNLAFHTDCDLMMYFGHEVRLVEGSPLNFKITTTLDLLLAEALVHRNPEI